MLIFSVNLQLSLGASKCEPQHSQFVCCCYLRKKGGRILSICLSPISGYIQLGFFFLPTFFLGQVMQKTKQAYDWSKIPIYSEPGCTCGNWIRSGIFILIWMAWQQSNAAKVILSAMSFSSRYKNKQFLLFPAVPG